MKFIEFKNVEVTFQTKTQKIKIFKDLNISFDKGEFVAIVGPSGMGKSTLLNLISGFLKPNAGKVLIEGKSLMKMSDKELCEYRNKSIGFIFQTFNLIPQFNVRDNIAVPILLRSDCDDKSFIDERITSLLCKVQMTNREFEYPNTLSGGEQQRVAFARAIANSPDIILADEPTGNLDSANSEILINMLCDLCNDEGKTIITVTHDERLMERAVRKVYIEDVIAKDL